MKEPIIINNLQDIFKVITVENFDRFILDLYKTLHYLAEIKEGLTEEEIKVIEFGSYEWTDDGESNIKIEVNEKISSKKI